MNIPANTPVLPPITTIRLFVYGTLKRGYHNHRLVP